MPRTPMYVPPLDSRLGATGARDLGPVVAEGLLGNAHQRKDRGRYAQLTSNSPNAVTLLDLNGDDQLGAGAQIACSVVPDTSEPGQESMAVPAILGHLRWGTDGASHDLDFDWVQGVLLSVAGSFVQVTARVLEVTADDPALSFKVRASIGYFPHSTPLRRSFRDRAVANLAIVRNPVPPFAREVEIQNSPQGSMLVVCEDRTGFPLAMRSSADPIRMTIPQDTARVAVANMTGLAQNQITTVYHLWV